MEFIVAYVVTVTKNENVKKLELGPPFTEESGNSSDNEYDYLLRIPICVECDTRYDENSPNCSNCEYIICEDCYDIDKSRELCDYCDGFICNSCRDLANCMTCEKNFCNNCSFPVYNSHYNDGRVCISCKK